MSKDQYFGSTLDNLYRSKDLRVPAFKVFLWNPNRTSVNDVVLKQEKSPRYDITNWVQAMTYSENIIFENTDDSVATNIQMDLAYAPNAVPIPIDHTTLIDGAPIRVLQGDARVSEDEWIIIFTGIIRGNPTVHERTREPNRPQTLTIACVERAESFLNTKVTARSYEQGEDIGKAVTETAIDFMDVDRREIRIGFQDYAIGHPQSQLVDIEIMKGIAQMLFVVGKKPKFDSEGFLTSADTDLEKPPARVHTATDLIGEIQRVANYEQINNSVRLLGLDDDLTRIVEREKRLAHGSITSGFFEDEVRETIWFSETQGKQSGGRKAIETRIEADISTLGDIFGETVGWDPFIEDDGETVFGGRITFDTGYDPEVRIALITTWVVIMTVDILVPDTAVVSGLAAMGTVAGLPAGSETASVGYQGSSALRVSGDLVLFGILLSMTELGKVTWEIFGKPVSYVYQQLAATAQLSGILTANRKELEVRNDWMYDLEVLKARAKELLKREIIKGWNYTITLLDDPILEVDDIIEIEDQRWYLTSIRKKMSRQGPPTGIMELTAWRLK